ncbi:APC family permease [Nonomuraea basaltis]|uniref:APC family permease n=1 Tax=Nonomuraea basaltis TaxID=2495887 RepID=UPI00110C5799|nr:APC family permease [Nonomuraea basaltis]TMR97817.1 APC family permease [Nonomuraea basaltis]
MTPTPDNTELARGRLSLLGVLTQSIGFMGPVFSIAALLPLVVGLSATGRGAGVAAPAAILIAAVGVAGVGWIISQYAKRIHQCGSLYDYVTRSAGPRLGLVGGWLYYGAMLVLAAATFLLLGGLTQDLLHNVLSVDVPWWPLSLGYVAIVIAVLVIGVQISIRSQLALALISMAVVFAFSLRIILAGGQGGDSLSATPFNPLAVGGLDLLYGVLYGINMFIGFESAANLAEETANPKRHIPRAVLLSLIVAGAFYVVTAYSQAVGFGLDAEAWKNSVFPLQALASGDEFGSPLFGDFVSVLVILDILAVAIGVGVAVTRGMFSMAREGRLPKALAVVHNRYRTPARAAVLLGVVSIGAIVVVVMGDGLFSRSTGEPGVLQPQWAPMFGWMAGFGGTGLALMYLVVSAAGVRGLWGQVSRGKLLVAAAAGVTVAAGAVFGAFYQAASPTDTIPWALLVWIALGTLWSYVALRRPAGPVETEASVAQAAPAGD